MLFEGVFKCFFTGIFETKAFFFNALFTQKNRLGPPSNVIEGKKTILRKKDCVDRIASPADLRVSPRARARVPASPRRARCTDPSPPAGTQIPEGPPRTRPALSLQYPQDQRSFGKNRRV